MLKPCPKPLYIPFADSLAERFYAWLIGLLARQKKTNKEALPRCFTDGDYWLYWRLFIFFR